MLQIRHLKSLGKVLDSDILHPKVRADLVRIYETLKNILKSKDSDKHFKEENYEI